MKFKAFILSLIIFALNCSSTNYNKKIKSAEKTLYTQNKPKEASRELLPYINEDNEDKLLFMMEAGMLLHIAEDVKNSNKVLLAADKLIAEHEKSISGEVASYFTNETGKPYTGEEFERVMLNLILGINFLKQKEYDDALVEFKKLNFRNNVILKKTKKYSRVNLLGKYLASRAAFAADEADYAYIELKQIEKVKSGLPIVVKDLNQLARLQGYKDDVKKYRKRFPQILTKRLSKKNLGNLVVIHQAGKAPIKISRGPLLKEPGMEAALRTSIYAAILTNGKGVSVTAAMAALASAEHPIPKYKTRRYNIKSAELHLTNAKGKVFIQKTTLLNDVGQSMKTTFEENYDALRSKMIARIATKIVATIVTQIIAEQTAKKLKAGGGLASLIGVLAGAAVGIVTMSQEKPDLRCWHTLPDRLNAAEFIVKPGKYNLKIKYLDNNSNIITETDEGFVNIEAGKISFLSFRTTN